MMLWKAFNSIQSALALGRRDFDAPRKMPFMLLDALERSPTLFCHQLDVFVFVDSTLFFNLASVFPSILRWECNNARARAFALRRNFDSLTLVERLRDNG